MISHKMQNKDRQAAWQSILMRQSFILEIRIKTFAEKESFPISLASEMNSKQ
jgi:hypothetical protein